MLGQFGNATHEASLVPRRPLLDQSGSKGLIGGQAKRQPSCAQTKVERLFLEGRLPEHERRAAARWGPARARGGHAGVQRSSLQSLIGGQASLAWDGAAGDSGSAIPCSAAAVAAELRDGAATWTTIVVLDGLQPLGSVQSLIGGQASCAPNKLCTNQLGLSARGGAAEVGRR